jgi:formamidopyrimidine-DNA glycosylase
VLARPIDTVTVLHPRAIRRHLAGPEDFATALAGRSFESASRRGKYLWLSVGEDALLAHLGMSGQLLLKDPGTPLDSHVRVRFTFADNGPDLRFTDQRTFGHMTVVRDGAILPAPIAHIAVDPFDPLYDPEALTAKLKKRHTVPTNELTAPQTDLLLKAVHEVMSEALDQGGTSFDSLYVNVNGQSGYFERSLAVYGREGQECRRCGAQIRRESFMNRSSYSCPRCQPSSLSAQKTHTI